MGTTDNSERLRRASETIIPGGVNSPVRAFRSVGGVPRFIEKGEGAFLTDVDGNRYLDFCCSWGPLILGHADPDVVRAVNDQVERGLTYGACTELEYKLARHIVDRSPGVEKIRFVSSGTEAVMSAIRLARGFTHSDLILKFEGCYHGHSDHLLVEAGSGLATFGQPSSAGIPDAVTSHTAVLPLDNDDRLERFFRENGHQLAAAIIEGIPANNGLLLQRTQFMKRLRELTQKYGALLILDEVITGFRIGPGGAAAYYDIVPDLTTFGKIIGGGMPVGAFGGRADIMDQLSPIGPVYQAGTLSGNPVAMAAGLATLEKLADGSVYDTLDKRSITFIKQLKQSLNGRPVSIPRVGSIFWIAFQEELPRSAHTVMQPGIATYNRLHSKMLDAGLYMPPSGFEVCFISLAHTDEMLSEAADKLSLIIIEGMDE